MTTMIRLSEVKMMWRLSSVVSIFLLVLLALSGHSSRILSEPLDSSAECRLGEIANELSGWSVNRERQFLLLGVSVLDKNNLWAVAREGGPNGLARSVILHSSDGGRTWERQMVTDWERQLASPAQHFISDIHFVDAEIGWIAGSSGLIFKSTDGGKNWVRQQAPTQADLDKIQFINANWGWILGDDGRDEAVILHTEDGGLNWRSHSLDVTGWINSFSFGDKSNGWLVGERGQAYQSDDAGLTWHSRGRELVHEVEHARTKDLELSTVQFLNPKLGFITASIKPNLRFTSFHRGAVFKTTNGGRSWKSIIAVKSRGIRYGEFLNDSEGWLVIDDLREERILHRENGGRAWTTIQTEISGILSVHFVDQANGWMVVNTSDYPGTDEIYHTNNGGKTWLELKLSSN